MQQCPLPKAQFALARQFIARGRVTEAITCYRNAATGGHSDAQFALALQLERQRSPEAVIWHRRAAEQGNAYAQNTLGQILERGLFGECVSCRGTRVVQASGCTALALAQYNLALRVREGHH